MYDLPLLDDNVLELISLLNLETHISLSHEEELLAFLQMIIFPLVRATDIEHLREAQRTSIFNDLLHYSGLRRDQDLQLGIVQHLVANGRQEELFVLRHPPVHVDVAGHLGLVGFDVVHHLCAGAKEQVE